MPHGCLVESVWRVTGSQEPLVHEVPQLPAVQSWPHEPQLVASV